MTVSIPESENFEILKDLEISKINKAESYLRWVRNRFRLNKINVKFDEAEKCLKLWKNSYGLQRSIDRFIIWKHSVKWEKYAEILFREKTAIINGFGNRKKRRKIDVLFNVIHNFKDMFKMKTGRVYNIFNGNNLNLLVRKAVKKKGKDKEVICYKEEMDLYIEKVSKN
jgi:hypothetical protein